LKATVAALGITLATASAADVIPITQSNAALAGFPGPYANLTVTLDDSNTATLTLTALGSYLFGGQGTLGVNFNGAVVLVGAITGNAGPGSPCPYSTGGAANEDGFGSFNFTIDTFDGANCASTTLSFTVDLLSGTWANAAAVTTANENGSLAAAHIYAGCTLGTDNTRTCQVTGYANNTGGGLPNEIPEPQSLALLAMGLLGLSLARRKRRK
jgi:hypothetical protein